jgi:hypothetical protein
VGGIVFNILIAVPAFLPSIVLVAISAPYPYVSITTANETRIIQVRLFFKYGTELAFYTLIAFNGMRMMVAHFITLQRSTR